MPKPSEYDKTHLRNMAAMGTRIDRIFKKATEEAAKIGVSIKDIDPDKIFSFDDYPETKKQIERLLTALKETTEKTIVNGVRSAWTLSNNKNDAMAEKVFGRDADKLPPEVRMKYFNNNESALQAFLARQQNGLNLSDRVWKYTNAFKQEIELGLDCGIRSGKDAPAMARELKQYLQYPDKLFRRVRDEHGLLQLSKAAADFHPGRGVYRSSYKNARRLAATETNIAYRTNDYLRWQQMDFVVGIEIQLSNNHTILLQPGEKTDDASQQRADGSPKANAVRPFTDICDTLAGRYPKDFKFTGWHPHCRCRAITILKTEEEMAKDNEAILNGEEVSTQSENSVKDVPQAFKDHVLKYGERIENTAPGRLPYYIQDNRKRVDKLLGLNNEPQRTPQEIAAERHANRTEQDKQGIQQAWNESRLNSLQEAINNGYLPEECKARLAELAKLNTPEHFDEFQAQIKTLQAQAQRHAARTPQDIADIKARWEKRVFINDKIRRDADRVLTLAKSYSEVDYAQLEKLIAQGKLAEMDAETQKVLQALKDMREQERALEDLIPDVHKWHKQFTLAELQEAHKSVEDTIAFWQTKYGANLAAGTNLETLQTELEKKIKFVENPGAYKAGAVQSKTWQVKQSAYMKHADQTYQKIKIIKATEQYEELAKFKTTSKDFNLYLQQAKEALDNGDTITANYKLSLANYKKATLEARRKTSVTSIAANFDAADYTEEAKNNAIWCKTAKASHKNWDADSEAAWNGATSGERKGWRDYTAGSGHMNRPLRGYDKNRNPHLKAWAKENFVGVGSVDLDLEGGEANIRNLYNLLERCTFDTNRWLQRGIETWDGFEGFLGFSKPGQSVTREQVRAMVGKEVTDHAFMSCGSAKGTGFNGVILNIYCPKGTKGLYACPHSCYGDYENETILQLGTKFRITKVECPDRGNVYIDLEVIGYEKHPLLK